MATPLANLNIATDTWLSMLTGYDEMRHAFSTYTVTTVANTTGAVTSGNAFVNGTFSANIFTVTSSIRGGTVSTPADLIVSSNLVSNGALSTINSNTTINGTITNINSTNTVIVGNVLTISSNTTTFSKNVNFSSLISVTANAAFSGANVYFNSSTQFAVNTAYFNLTGTLSQIASNLVVSAAVANITGTSLNITSNVNINNVNTTLNSTNTVISGGNLTVNSTLSGNLVSTSNSSQLGNNTNRFAVLATNVNSTGDVTTSANLNAISVLLNSTCDLVANSVTNGTNTSAPRILFSLAKATYRSGKIDFQVKDLSNNYQITTLTFVHDDTSVSYTSSETLNTNTQIAIFSADYSANASHIDIMALQSVPNTNIKWFARIFR